MNRWRHKVYMGVAVAGLILAGTILFLFSLPGRAPWFGEAPMNIAGWMTGGSTMMARHWWREGPAAMHFGMYWEPDSVERPYVGTHTPYVSYPAGSIAPLYCLGLLRGNEPDIAQTMRYNLVVQYLIALVLGLTSWRLARAASLSTWPAFWLALTPMVLYSYTPISYHEHQMSYFADAAVLLPFSLYIYLETFHGGLRNRWGQFGLSALQAGVAVWGMYTDWLFAFLAVCVWLTRLLSGRFGRNPVHVVVHSVAFAAPFLFAAAVFLVQVYRIGAVPVMLQRFLMRSGALTGPALFSGENLVAGSSLETFLSFSFDTRFWKEHLPAAFGDAGLKILFVTMGALLVLVVFAVVREAILRIRYSFSGRRHSAHTGTGTILIVCILFLAPCLLNYHVFKQHNNLLFHRYSALKFAVPFAALPFSLLPILMWTFLFPRVWKPRGFLKGFGLTLPLLLSSGAAIYLYTSEPVRVNLFKSDRDLPQVALGKFIDENVRRDDVVFMAYPPPWTGLPQFTGYAMKQVWGAPTLWEMLDLAQHVPVDFQVVLISADGTVRPDAPDLPVFQSVAAAGVVDGPLHLYRMSKRRFLDLCQRYGISGIHPEDANEDGHIAPDELGHIVSLYLAGAYHCAVEAPLRYVSGPGFDATCLPHPADTRPERPDGRIALCELLQVIQLANSPGYSLAPGVSGRFAPRVSR